VCVNVDRIIGDIEGFVCVDVDRIMGILSVLCVLMLTEL
jgi:hypothetical protein